MIKVTKKMVDRAEDEHFIREDVPSLVNLHALKSLYFKQKGNLKLSEEFITSSKVKKMIKELEGGNK